MKTFACAVALALGLALAPTAHAQTAEALIQEGLELRRQGNDAEALVRFEAAYRMSQSAQSLAQIALAEQAMGRFVAAETHLSTAIQITTDPWIASRLPQLEQALASIQAQLGTIEIVGGAPGAVVFVNGEARGTLPQAARQRARAGSVVIEIRADGYAPVQRQVQVQAGGTWRENVAMIAVSGGVTAQPLQGQPVQGQPVQEQPVQGQPYPGQPYPGQPAAQPVAGSPAGYAAPATRTESHPNWKLFGAGIGIFGGLWIATGIIATSIDPESEEAGIAWIPLVGPFVLLDYADDDFFFTILLIDGLAQTAGVVMAVLGLVIPVEETVMALGDEPRAPTLALRPGLPSVAGLGETGLGGAALAPPGGASAGLTLELTHF